MLAAVSSAKRRPAPPPPVATERAWWDRPGLVLLPLRAFLGVTFIYAGLMKLADPAYLDPSQPQSVAAQMHIFAKTSPIGGLVSLAASHPTLFGLAIAFGELAAGLGALLGLWTRLAAAGGLALSLSFFLTVSWNTHPYFYGSDIVFVFAWLTVLLAGDGGVFSLGSMVAASVRGQAGGRRAGADPDLDRRVLVRTGAVAAGVGGLALIGAGLTAWLGRVFAGSSGSSGALADSGSTSTPSPSATASPSATSSMGPPAKPSPTAAASSAAPGVAVGPASSVAVGQAVPATDPSTGGPVWVVHTSKGFKAFSAICTHAGCPVQFIASADEFGCPCHGSIFDGTTGQALRGPAVAPLPPVQVVVVDGTIRLI